MLLVAGMVLKYDINKCNNVDHIYNIITIIDMRILVSTIDNTNNANTLLIILKFRIFKKAILWVHAAVRNDNEVKCTEHKIHTTSRLITLYHLH